MSYNGRESGSINGRQPPLGQYVETADYVVFKEDGVIKAKEGTDASIEKAGSSADEVIQYAISQLPSGGHILLLGGTFTINKSITIDTGNITLSGIGMKKSILKVADGANIEAIKVGTTSSVSSVTIQHLGIDGNKDNQTGGDRQHGIVLEDCSNSRVLSCYITRTYPYHVHDTGGSGITLRHESTNCVVKDNFIEDIGDRAIQCGGVGHLIADNLVVDGFDRAVSLDYYDKRDDTWYGANRVDVIGNIANYLAEGSLIGVLEAGGDDLVITGNFVYDYFRGLVQHGAGSGAVISNNYAYKKDGDTTARGILANSGDVIVGNMLKHVGTGTKWTQAIHIGGDNTLVVGNHIEANTADGIGVQGANVTVAFNKIMGFGANEEGQAITTGSQNNMLIMGNMGGTNNSANDWINCNSAGDFVVVGNFLMLDGYTAPNNYYRFDNGHPVQAYGNYPPYYRRIITSTFAGGETKTFPVWGAFPSENEHIEVWAAPNNEPGNDHGYKVESVYWDDSAGNMYVRVTETENAGGGEARIVTRIVHHP